MCTEQILNYESKLADLIHRARALLATKPENLLPVTAHHPNPSHREESTLSHTKGNEETSDSDTTSAMLKPPKAQNADNRPDGGEQAVAAATCHL